MSEVSTPWYRSITGYQWLVLTVCWLGWMFDIMDTALFAFAKVPMLTEMLGGPEQYKLHGPATEGLIQMVFLVGWAVGGLIFGILADRCGRTRTMVLTILLYCLFTGLTSLCHTPEQVAAVRFLTALGIGGEWAAGAALVAEVFSDKARAPAAGVLQSAAAFGPALAATLNLGLAAQSWRWLFVVGILPAAITILIRAKVKEPENWVQTTEEPRGSIAELFSNPMLRRNVIIASILAIVGIAGAGNTSFWLPNLVKSVSEGLDLAVIQQRTSYATYVLHIGTLLGVLFFPWLCQKMGRRPAFAIFFAASPFAILLVTVFAKSFAMLLLTAPLMSFFTIGLSSGFVLYFTELFPTRLRATGSGFAYNVARVGAAPFPWLTGLLISGIAGTVGLGVAAAGFIYLLGLIALPFARETKGEPLPV